MQARPLYDALAYRYCNIEVDIIPLKEELIVSHGPFGLKRKPKLVALYLEPLDSIITAHAGTVYLGDSTIVTLMIDLKGKKRKSLQQLIPILDQYKHLWARHINGETIWGPIRILLSGCPPLDMMSEYDRDYIFLDGRPGQVVPPHLRSKTLTISTSWKSLPKGKKRTRRILDLLRSCEQYGRQLRIWASPDNKETWKYLDSLGVHIINVDDLRGFYEYRSTNQ